MKDTAIQLLAILGLLYFGVAYVSKREEVDTHAEEATEKSGTIYHHAVYIPSSPFVRCDHCESKMVLPSECDPSEVRGR